MIRVTSWFLAASLLAVPHALSLQNPTPPATVEAVDEARERKVMERFLAVLEKTPRRGTALDRVYGYHVERGSLDAFLKGYRDKVAADPKDGASWLILGLVEAQRGKDSLAVEAFRKAETTRSDDALPAFYLGQALVLVGQPDSASEAFERALARKPLRTDLLDIYQALGRVHQRAHRNDKALAVWDRLEKAFPDDPRVQEQIAHALADESQDAAALIRFESLAKATKDRFRQVQFALEAAELKVRLGKSSEALADFESLLGKLDPESWLYREVRRKVEDVFLRTDDLAGLANYYERWIKKVPDDVEGMARLGRTLANQGRSADARKWFDQAVKLAPSRRELRLALIEQLVQERQYADAASQYEALAKLEPNNPDVIRDWGRMLLRDANRPEIDRKKAAATVWRRLAPDDARDAVMIAQAADLFRQAGLTDDALALYDRAIRLAPDSSQYREYLGEYYHALKRPSDALATWRSTVAGPNRNAKTLGRLGEVLAGFGYRQEALEPLTEACRLEPDDFDLRLRLADLRLALEQPLEAIVELEKAQKSAAADEQLEAVLDRQIRAYQASNTLGGRIDGLRHELEKTPDATGWTRLARLLEADQKPPEAVQAIEQATKIDPRSVPAWVATARLREAAGDLLGSANALRTLTKLDRRSRTDYLTGIAKLESRLGRRGPALEAGRELLAAAPGNPENHQFFAELCFSLGEPDEGLDALRRAARANPSDPKAMLTLAENLARQFRTEEAIELFWRAFAKTLEIEGKLAIVARLADQYLQRNQLDRLIARLERELREPNQQRELSLCLAQAHAASGDYATARLELERLLATNPRDTQLLNQLSTLSEQEGDTATAAKYQKLAIDLAPSAEGTSRLASLYFKAGEETEAEAVWSRLATDNQDPSRVLAAVDHLLTQNKYESVLAITERMLVQQPGDWEALYREGVALEGLGKPVDAIRRFRMILDLKLNDEEVGLGGGRTRSKVIGPSTAKGSGTKPGKTLGSSSFPIQPRIEIADQVREAAKLDNEVFFNGGTSPTTWTPPEFGQARMAAIAWLFKIARKDDKQDDLVKAFREARDKADGNPRPQWDWFYLQLVRAEGPAIFEAARDLAKALPTDLSASYAYLDSLAGRSTEPGSQQTDPVQQDEEVVAKILPLPPEDLDRALAAYRDLRKRKSDVVSINLMLQVNAELKRAKREGQVEQFYREAIAAAEDLGAVDSAMMLAAERGDVDTLLALQEKSDRLRDGKTIASPTGAFAEHPLMFARVMSLRADTKAYGDVARLFDRYMESIRSPEAVSRRAKARNLSMAGQNQPNYTIRLGKKSTYIEIEYPQPNAYFDFQAIQLLRNTYELYKRDDLMSDLVSHLKTEADRLPEAEKVYPLLALGYVEWWNDEKDEALRDLTRAADSAKGDVDLRLGLAELQARRGEPAEALAMVDAVQPLDQKAMLRREVLALRLSVMAGDVERARKASERLFGLRLDADTQVQLAGQMNQLGMHELAESVLARARRRAGGNTSALVALMLQYQRQGKTDTAFQVANQILRMSATRTFSPFNNNNNSEDQARGEAIQVFARSGKLKELIERAEAQLKVSPNSFQVLQSLTDYYRASGDKTRTKETYERMAKIRPDDANFRLQVASQLFQDGDAASAIEHYSAALKKEPSFYIYRYWEIEQAYRQLGKMDELARVFDEVDLKPFASNPYAIQQIVSSMLQDEKTRDQGIKLFRKVWKSVPDARANLIANMEGDVLWSLPEVYDNVKDVVIPAAGKTNIAPWASVDQIYSWSGDGKVSGLITRLLDSASKQNKLEQLGQEVDGGIKRFPEWSGGRAIKAILLIRLGKSEEARQVLTELMEKDKNIPISTRMIVGQELEGIKLFGEVELKLYEGAIDLDEVDDNGMGFQYGPMKRLITLYHQGGKDALARDLILKLSRKPSSSTYSGNTGYATYQRLAGALGFGFQMVELGFPADAVRFFDEVVGDSEAIQEARRASGGQDQLSQQASAGLDQAFQGLNPKNLARTLETLAPPPSSAGEKVTPRSSRTPSSVDLLLVVHPRDLTGAAVTSLMGEAIRSAIKSKQSATLEGLKLRLSNRVPSEPGDPSVLIATALVEAAEGDQGAVAKTSSQLAAWAEAHPLDPLPVGTRPNARQRLEATRQLGLWLVAREAMKHEPSRKPGEILEARAFEAARRQADHRWTLAMLREGGQAALDRGDRATAEKLWRLMLHEILAPTSNSKPRKPATAPDEPMPDPAAIVPPLRAFLIAVAIAQVPAVPAPVDGFDANPGQQPRVPPPPLAPGLSTELGVATLERFEQAVQLAKLAAAHEMFGLSADAVREALSAGPPVVPIPIEVGQQPTQLPSNNGTADPVSIQVEARLAELEALWTLRKAPPMPAYLAIRSVVLPDSRPGEVFLYPRPLAMFQGDLDGVKSVGLILARRAVETGQVEDLRRRIDARKDQPLASIPALVLLSQLSVAAKDEPETARILAILADRLRRNTLQVTAELACHAALPALELPQAGQQALSILQTAAKTMGGTGESQPVGSLLLLIAKQKFRDRKPVEGREFLLSYLDKMQNSNMQYGNDYTAYFRKLSLATVAGEFAKAAQTDDAWEMLGRYADAPNSAQYGADMSIGSTLTRVFKPLLALTPLERYARLKSWTLPTLDRKSVRLLASIVPEDKAIPTGFGPIPHARMNGVASTPAMLIEAARDAGKLDDLVAEVQQAASAKVENASTLLILTQIATGQGSQADPAIRARVVENKKLLAAFELARQNQNGGQPQNVRQVTVEWTDYLILRASMGEPSLSETAEALVKTLIDASQYQQNPLFQNRLRRDQLLCRAARLGRVSEPLGPNPDPGLASWHPVSLLPASFHAQGSMDAYWVESGGTIEQVTGPNSEFLLFDYPLTGKFEVNVDSLDDPETTGLVGYAGLLFGPNFNGSVWPVSHFEQRMVSSHFERPGDFNRTTIRSEPGKLVVLRNGRLFYEQPIENPTSPWVTLYGNQQQQSLFRHITIDGSPEIPREVTLVRGDHLEGWACGFYGETQPPRLSLGQLQQDPTGETPGIMPVKVGDLDQYDYHAKNGVLHGRRVASSASKASSSSRIYYYRPIQDRESVTYQFFYEPGRVVAHPTLERLAFLLEPDGVRLRWLTDGVEDDWTDLPPDNKIEAAEFRRGPSPLPFRSGEWNSTTIKLEAGLVSIDLNGVRIFEYPLEQANQRIFGFTHDKRSTALQVKEIVLRGDWPTKVPADLLARANPNPSLGESRARASQIDEKFILLDAAQVLEQGRELGLADRYPYLLGYVLPSPDHSTFRLRGSLKPEGSSHFGTLEGPAIELVETAKGLGKLNDLMTRLEGSEALDDQARRGKAAIRVLIQVAREDDARASKALEDLKPMLARVVEDEPEWSRWPELVAASVALDRPALAPLANALLHDMDEQWRKRGLADWGKLVRVVKTRGTLKTQAGTTPKVPGWSSVTSDDATSRGRGLPEPTWTFADNTWTHQSGHRFDQLYLSSPLKGDFEVHCELSSFDWREAQLSYAGLAIAIQPDKKTYMIQGFGSEANTGMIDPPFAEIKPWYAYRLSVKNGIYAAYVDGRKVHEQRIGEDADPWLAITTIAESGGGVRNLKVIGNPTIPEVLALSSRPGLGGWRDDYYQNWNLWEKKDDEIHGLRVRDPNAPMDGLDSSAPTRVVHQRRGVPIPEQNSVAGVVGSKEESVLKYHRPLLEDGELTYEFFYEPGSVMVHPALDRLTFLIAPDGVKIHKMTDAQYDRTGLLPDNVSVEPEHRKGPESPPLRPGEWNRIKLKLTGDVASITLNDVLIYDRPLEPTNHRVFGLFRYADETEARVRNVSYRGQWARSLPDSIPPGTK